MSAAILQRDVRALAGAALLGLAMGAIAARMPLAAVGLIAAAAGIVIVTTRADLVLLAMIAALPWENKLHYPSEEFSTVKGIGALVLLAYVLRMVRDRRAGIQLPGLVGIVAALLVWVGVSFVTAPDPSESTTTLVRWVLLVTFFFLVIQLVDGRQEIRRAMRWFATSVTAAARGTRRRWRRCTPNAIGCCAPADGSSPSPRTPAAPAGASTSPGPPRCRRSPRT